MPVRPRRVLPIALALPLLVGSWVAPAGAATVATDPARPQVTTAPSSDTAPAEPVFLPSIHWEEAQAHANDVLSLPPGDRVTVGFTPRADDAWQIGGDRPRALPAGEASGRALRNLARVTPDSPLVDPAEVVDAAPASVATTSAPAPMSLAAKVSAKGLRKEVFGFLPYWELTDQSTTLDDAKLSTIAYFGVGAAADGTLERTTSSGATTIGWSGWTSAQLTGVIDDATGPTHAWC